MNDMRKCWHSQIGAPRRTIVIIVSCRWRHFRIDLSLRKVGALHVFLVKTSARRLQISLPCAVLCQIVSLQYLSMSSLDRSAGLPYRLFLSYGLQVVTREVHRSSLKRLMWPAQDQFIFLTLLIISMTFVFSLTQMLVFLSLYAMLSILLSILVCAAASLLCACLVSVQVSAPYVIAGSTQELYTCLFRQLARLLLKISWCLALILRFISLSWFFSLML